MTVVEFMDKPMPFADGEVSNYMLKHFGKEGFKFLLNHKVVAGQVGSNSAKITIEDNKTKARKDLEADIVLVATGRRPYTAALGAKELGVRMDKQGRIDINDHFQTSVSNIYAIGDVVRGPMLAHKAEEEGIAVVEHLLGEGGHVNYKNIPGVIYTHPEVAFVGETEEELKKAGKAYKKGFFPMMANSRARANHDSDGFIKVLTDKKTDKILGVHMVTSNAGEAIAEAVLAMEYGASAEDIGRTCHAHPTCSEAMKEACLGAFDKAIHF